MKYKKLELKSAWEIVKEDDDFLLAIIPHRGEDEADRLADAVLALLNDPIEKPQEGQWECQCDDCKIKRGKKVKNGIRTQAG